MKALLRFFIFSRVSKPSNLKHLTFSRLKEIAQYPKDFPIQNFKLILAILSDERVNILVEILKHIILKQMKVLF